MDIYKNINTTIQKYNMLNKGDRVLIGVSGGPDSITLLHALNSFKKHYDLTLKVAHLEHQIRGEESKEDLEFVRKVGEKLNVDFCFKSVDVLSFAEENKISTEKAAREVRYDFFNEIAEKESFHKLALGHNKDDQVETILMRIIRGTGLAGLQGIPEVRKIQKNTEVLLIRPLIEISSEEIRTFLKENNISFRIDSSNKDLEYFRNEIRQELLPKLEEYNSNIKELIINMSDNIGVVEDYINQQGKRRYGNVASKKNKKIYINIERLKKHHTAIQREIFRNAIMDLKGNLKKITFQHWQEFKKLIEQRPVGSIVHLPYDMAVRKEDKKAVFYREGNK